jgi:hypothetical protein
MQIAHEILAQDGINVHERDSLVACRMNKRCPIVFVAHVCVTSVLVASKLKFSSSKNAKKDGA